MSIRHPKYKEGSYEPDGYEESYVKRVLFTGERNFYHDSDFYAIVWDDEAGVMKNIEYDTTRFAGGGSANVDFSPESDPEGWANMVAAIKEDLIPKLEAELLAKHENPIEGDEVDIIAGPNAGMSGTVFFRSETRDRIGIDCGNKPGDCRVWTTKENLKKLVVELDDDDREYIASIPDDRFVGAAINMKRGGAGINVVI